MERSATKLNTGLLRFGPDRSWLRFIEPVETITVWELAEVLPALERAEAANEAGQWVVGLLSYDAGPAFDPAVVSKRDLDTPLLAFGIFEAPEESAGPLNAPFEVGEWRPDQSQAEYSKAIEAVRLSLIHI